MKHVCAWCGKDRGEVESRFDEQYAVTHGMCPDCSIGFAREGMKLPFRQFLDRLEVPVVAIHSDTHVITVNCHAEKLLDREYWENGHYVGDAMECVHARQPGGCGQQVHCKSCTIRKTVLETFATGKCQTRVPAYLDAEMFAEVKRVRLAISTEKVGNIVLLRIDELKAPDEDGQTG